MRLVTIMLAAMALGPATASGQYPYESGDSDLRESVPDYAGQAARARVELASAREARDEARLRLQAARSDVREQLRLSPEYDRARLELSRLRDRYRTVRAEVRDDLQADNPAYQQAEDKVDALEEQIAVLRDEEAPQDQVVALSKQVLRWQDRADTIYYQALEQRTDIDQIESDLVEAQDTLDRLETQHADRIERAPEVVRARQDLRDARDDMDDLRADLADYRARYRSAIRQAEADDRVIDRTIDVYDVTD